MPTTPPPPGPPATLPSDLEIARAAHLEPIEAVAEAAGIGVHRLEPYGRHVAKVDLAALDDLADRPPGRYVVITAITPTPLGEGKTTTAVGLAQGLQHLGHRATLALRQPSMGPGRSESWKASRSASVVSKRSMWNRWSVRSIVVNSAFGIASA